MREWHCNTSNYTVIVTLQYYIRNCVTSYTCGVDIVTLLIGQIPQMPNYGKCEDLIFLLNKEEHTLQIWYQNSKLFLTVVNYNKTSELATLYSLHFMQDEILQNYFLCKIQIRLYSTVYFNCNETELFIFCITSNSSLIFSTLQRTPTESKLW